MITTEEALSAQGVQVPAYVIGSYRDEKTRALIAELNRYFSASLFPSRFLSQQEFSRLDSETLLRFRAYMGRFPSIGEIGCALAHLGVYESFLSASTFDWCLVLEDDAILSDTMELGLRCQEIQRLDPSCRIIWTFYTRGDALRTFSSPGPIKSSFVTRISPSFAVAYMISRTAAELIIENRDSVPRIADWPIQDPRISFIVDELRLVEHGREAYKSQTRTPSFVPLGVPRFRRVQKWLWLWFWRNWRYFSPQSYLFSQILPGLFRLLGRLGVVAPRARY